MSFINFSGPYQPPGVYVTQTTSPVISVPVATNTQVAIVGPTRGYTTFTDTVTLSATAVPLSKNGITLSSVVVTDSANNVLSSGTGYALVQTGTGSASVTTIALGTAPTYTSTFTAANPTVYVNYQYADANYSNPQSFNSLNAIANFYGPAFDANGNVLNPVTLGASLVYANGNPIVTIMPTADTSASATTQANLAAAYTSLQSNTAIGIVIPLPVGLTVAASIQGVFSDLKTHCDSLASQGIYRMGIVGYDQTVTASPQSLFTSGDGRMVMAYPNQLNYINPQSKTITVSGYYLAAAFAGFLSSNPVQQGLTRQAINGFAGLPSSYLVSLTRAAKNTYAAAGVSVCEVTPKGALVCRQGLTTQVGNILTEEISLVRSGDQMMNNIQETILGANLIGTPQTGTTPALVQSAVQSALDALVANGVIIAYTSLNSVVSSTTPTVISVSFSYQPAYPLNYVTVSFSVNTSTGNVTSIA